MARKILLADDSVTAQNMGRKILADAGYEVITVNNGSAALKKIADAKPDLIVLDVYMPGYSGLEVCQRLKEAGDTARIPILLTVGKLEPFKPEEAKRVRAEGFIVKPFEASELLSALAKLEDKIVPRADSSKPGRFARAIAAVEEGRYDNTVAIDEDTGWKNRIAFPSKKKAKAPEPEDNNDPAIYNPVNRDLKTVIEPHKTQGAPAKVEQHVDLGALAPEGLPKDVTAEEIAALAAAAAQVKGIVEAGSGPAPSVNASAGPSTETPAIKVDTATKAEETKEPVSAAEVKSEATETQSKIESSTAEKVEASASSHELVPEPAGQSPAVPEGATFAVQKSQDEATGQEAQPAVAEAETHSDPQPVSSALESSANSLPPSDAPSSEAASSDAPWQQPAQPLEAEPVTMAHAASENGRPSRWTAVATALAPEEVGVVLEEEMRKVYAAFVGADSSASHHSVPSTGSLQPGPVPPAEGGVAISQPAPEPVAATVVEGSPQAETGLPVPMDPIFTPETASENVKQFEAEQSNSIVPPAPVAAEPEHVEPGHPEPAPPAASAEISTASVIEEAVPAVHTAEEPGLAQVAASVAEPPLPQEEPTASLLAAENISDPQVESAGQSEPDEPSTVANLVESSETPAIAEAAKAPEVPAAEVDAASSPEGESPVASVEPVASPEPSRQETPDAARKESEIAATTAAAWASWRRIRESGDRKTDSASSSAPVKNETKETNETKEAPAPKDEAAMAVAAGAERVPEDVSESSEESPEIATIVDTVLADLRPKIVEEISRKLGKKNKKK